MQSLQLISCFCFFWLGLMWLNSLKFFVAEERNSIVRPFYFFFCFSVSFGIRWRMSWAWGESTCTTSTEQLQRFGFKVQYITALKLRNRIVLYSSKYRTASKVLNQNRKFSFVSKSTMVISNIYTISLEQLQMY